MPRTELANQDRATNALPIRFYPEQRQKLKTASRKTRLSEQDLVRKLVDVHLHDLEQVLTGKAA